MHDDDWFMRAEAALNSTGRSLNEPYDNRPVVAVYGAYDAGKSTLVKRLLVEAGQSVPSWLTISARPETFEANDVEAFGCVLRDTPGIAGGNTRQQNAADRALLDADVTLLVMPPQLLTGNRDHVLARIKGSNYRQAGLFTPESWLFVITKLDEGEDPSENLQAYYNRLELKRAEWGTLLESNGLPTHAVPLFAISADPYGEVGNDPSPSADSYTAGCSEWDGVADLVSTLRALPDRLPHLRRWTRLRRACGLLRDALAEAEHLQARADQSAAEARSRKHTWIAEFGEQHEQLIEVGRSVLSRVVEEELNSFFTRRSNDDEELRAKIEAICNGWLNSQLAALAKLAHDSDAHLSPLDTVSITVAPLPQGAHPTKQKAAIEPTLQKKLAKPFGNLAQDVIGLTHHLKLNGKSTSDLKKELDEERKKNPKEPAVKALEALLNTSQWLDQYKKAAPNIAEATLAGIDLIIASARRRASAEASAKEVAERQKLLTECASRAAAMATDSIASHFSAYREWLDAEAAHCDAVISAASDQLALSSSRIEKLRCLIENAPAPRS
jgi:hypothetical protein